MESKNDFGPDELLRNPKASRVTRINAGPVTPNDSARRWFTVPALYTDKASDAITVGEILVELF